MVRDLPPLRQRPGLALGVSLLLGGQAMGASEPDDRVAGMDASDACAVLRSSSRRDVRWVESRDTDGDGLPDLVDADDDGDGIADEVEGDLDLDGDGLPASLDLDSDGDGIPDALEARPTSAWGLPFELIVDPALLPDTDGDGRPDVVDADADGDGLPDALEAGFGPFAPVDVDGDGLADAVDADPCAWGPVDAALRAPLDFFPDADGGARDGRGDVDWRDPAVHLDGSARLDVGLGPGTPRTTTVVVGFPGRPSPGGTVIAGVAIRSEALQGPPGRRHDEPWRADRYGATAPHTAGLASSFPHRLAPGQEEDMGKNPLTGGCSTTGSPAGIGGVLLAALALGARRRRVAAAAVGLMALPGVAAAQSANEPRLDANFFENNPQTATFTIVRDAEQARRGTISGEITTDYGLNPLDFKQADDVGRRGDVLDHAVGLHLGFNAAVTDWLELGFNMPLLQSVFYGSQTAENNAIALGGSGDNLGIGDLDLQFGISPLNWIRNMPVKLSLVPRVIVPTGTQDVFASSGSVKAGGNIVVGGRWEHFRFSVMGGGLWQDESRQVGDIYEDDVADWGAAVAVPFLDSQVEVRAEHRGKIVVSDEARDRLPDYDWNRHAPMELLFGAAYVPKDFPMYVEAGIGPGLTPGFGAADVRAFLTVGARTLPKARLAAITDADGDGIADEYDVCPYKAEDIDGFQDSDGCPDLDNDNDGIADVDDACINRPEVYNDYEDADGCPDQVASQVEVRDREIVLYDKVYFEYDRATLRPVSKRVLDEVVATLKAHPEITRVELGGHADERGNQLYNLELSRQRAQAVRNYLVSQGIEADRLVIAAYGEERPEIPNARNEEDYAKNRRVQLTVQMTDDGLDLDDIRTVDADVPAIPVGFDPPDTDNDIPGLVVEIPG